MHTLRLSRRAADRLRTGHLWVYRTDIEAASLTPQQGQPEEDNAEGAEPPEMREPAAGALVTLTDSRGIPLGAALYSTASVLAARLVSTLPGLTRAQYLADLRHRVLAALALRRELAPFSDRDSAHRLIFSEADNLPGIVADRYNNLVLLQLLTQGTAQDDVRRTLVDALRAGLAESDEASSDAAGSGPATSHDASSPGGESAPAARDLTIWERPDPRIRELENLPAPPAGPLFTTHAGPDAPTLTTFALNGVRFHYDAGSGQKTGAFLDQRLNYAAAARAVQTAALDLAARAPGPPGLRGLDICTYQGGFALHLAQVCTRVTGVDASRSALEAADRNLLLNPRLNARCETDWVEADAFEYLRHLDELAHPPRPVAAQQPGPAQPGPTQSGPAQPASTPPGIQVGRLQPVGAAAVPVNPNLFDVVVLDPPAFAKSKRAAEGALRGYKELNLRALRILSPGGILVTCSCSHHVSLADFTAVVAAAAADAGRRVQLLDTRAAAPDHPEILTLAETRYLKCLICRVD